MKILISMISNNPDNVKKFLQKNNYFIKSSKHDISIRVNFNGIPELPSLELYKLNIELVMVPPLIDNGEYRWNTTRLEGISEKLEFDYIHLLDDDVVFKCNLDYLYDSLDPEVHKFVQVTSERLSDVYNDSTGILNSKKPIKSVVKLRKVDKITTILKLTAGGHIMSRDYFFKHYEAIKSYDVFNEDTWRCYIALLNKCCYVTKNRLAFSEYNSLQYNPEQRYISLARFLELNIPVYVNDFNSIEPLVNRPISGCTKVGDHIYCSNKIGSSLVRKYISRNSPEITVL